MIPNDVATLVFHIRVNGYVEMVASTLVWYDYLLTLRYERQYFWGRRLNWMNMLFYWNRYLPIVAQLFILYGKVSHHVNYPFCFIDFGIILPGSGLNQIIVVDIILLVRLYAMYGRSKRVLYFLIGLYTVCTCAAVGDLIPIGIKAKGTANPAPGLTACVVTSEGKHFWSFWIAFIFYETVAFCMVIYKAYTDLTYTWTSRATSQRLLRVLYRDSLIYFAAIFALYIANSVSFSIQDTSINDIADGPTRVLIAIIGNRILFNLREEDARSRRQDVSTNFAMTDLEFAPPDSSDSNNTKETDTTAVDPSGPSGSNERPKVSFLEVSPTPGSSKLPSSPV